MPKVNTFNYDTIASWNGAQDLFVVEQPDGTKVATPAMVKQFIEAGDFEATGEIKDGHGNILNDMAKSVDVDAEIGDLSQTGLTGDSVSEQLATAREYIATKRSISVYPSVIGSRVDIASYTDYSNPFTTPHEGFLRFAGTNIDLRLYATDAMRSSSATDVRAMWLPKGVKISFSNTPNYAHWYNCSDE